MSAIFFLVVVCSFASCCAYVDFCSFVSSVVCFVFCAVCRRVVFSFVLCNSLVSFYLVVFCSCGCSRSIRFLVLMISLRRKDVIVISEFF